MRATLVKKEQRTMEDEEGEDTRYTATFETPDSKTIKIISRMPLGYQIGDVIEISDKARQKKL